MAQPVGALATVSVTSDITMTAPSSRLSGSRKELTLARRLRFASSTEGRHRKCSGALRGRGAGIHPLPHPASPGCRYPVAAHLPTACRPARLHPSVPGPPVRIHDARMHVDGNDAVANGLQRGLGMLLCPDQAAAVLAHMCAQPDACGHRRASVLANGANQICKPYNSAALTITGATTVPAIHQGCKGLRPATDHSKGAPQSAKPNTMHAPGDAGTISVPARRASKRPARATEPPACWTVCPPTERPVRLRVRTQTRRQSPGARATAATGQVYPAVWQC